MFDDWDGVSPPLHSDDSSGSNKSKKNSGILNDPKQKDRKNSIETNDHEKSTIEHDLARLSTAHQVVRG